MSKKAIYFESENALCTWLLARHMANAFQPSFLAIDEVGRGCLAGDVCVCASFWMPAETHHPWLPLVRDSKQLSPQKRGVCFEAIQHEYKFDFENLPLSEDVDMVPGDLCDSPHRIQLPHQAFLPPPRTSRKKVTFQCVSFALGLATAAEIDGFNIWNATQLSAARALCTLKTNVDSDDVLKRASLLMDGKHFIKVPKFFADNVQVAVVNADQIFVTVGFSSVVAKVVRDHHMNLQHSLYPMYGFSAHKGYGTKKHFENIKQHGTCVLHRRSFLKNFFVSQ